MESDNCGVVILGLVLDLVERRTCHAQSAMADCGCGPSLERGGEMEKQRDALIAELEKEKP